nr:unnamed protein product [Spirometra erinaceieuropaei]
MNAQSLISKLDELNLCLAELSPDVLAVTEIWRSGNICDSEVVLPGYQIYRRDREHRQGGGIVVYVNEGLAVSENTTKFARAKEAIWLTIKATGSPCLDVLTLYRPPRTDQIADTQLLLEKFSSRPNIMIMGDFNAPGTNWNTLQASGPKFAFDYRLLNKISKASLTQHGSRLKIFCSFDEASSFATSTVPENQPGPITAVSNESCPFPTLKQEDLLRFRRLIETSQISVIQSLVDDNPLWLITNCDTPSILQVRFRYNAFHVAALSGRADAIQAILSILESNEFWSRLRPSADALTVDDRRNRLLDLYFNSPEIGSFSRPLHLASKFGHVQCVRLLASHPVCSVNLRDSVGQTPAEVACSRLDETDETLMKKQEIRRILDEHYVALVARLTPEDSEPQPVILPALNTRSLLKLLFFNGLAKYPGLQNFCSARKIAHPEPSPNEHSSPEPTTSTPARLPFSPSSSSPSSPYSPSSVTSFQNDLQGFGSSGQFCSLRALLGPLSCDEARRTAEEWLKPSDPEWSQIRLLDAEKGYERHGRFLSSKLKTTWTEYWSFLDDFADLRTDYGLSALNAYLAPFYQNDNPQHFKPAVSASSVLPNCALFDDYKPTTNQDSSDQDHDATVAQMQASSTPIKRSIPSASPQTDGDCDPPITSDRWTVYREDRNPIRVLADSLEDSSSSSIHETCASDCSCVCVRQHAALGPSDGYCRRNGRLPISKCYPTTLDLQVRGKDAEKSASVNILPPEGQL